jgi:hypothetical protein
LWLPGVTVSSTGVTLPVSTPSSFTVAPTGFVFNAKVEGVARSSAIFCSISARSGASGRAAR